MVIEDLRDIASARALNTPKLVVRIVKYSDEPSSEINTGISNAYAVQDTIGEYVYFLDRRIRVFFAVEEIIHSLADAELLDVERQRKDAG